MCHQGIQFLEAVPNLMVILLNLWALTGMLTPTYSLFQF